MKFISSKMNSASILHFILRFKLRLRFNAHTQLSSWKLNQSNVKHMFKDLKVEKDKNQILKDSLYNSPAKSACC